MSDRSTIEWTDATWNPMRGCEKLSPGCKHCYAETFAERFRGVRGHPFERGFEPVLVPGKLSDPLTWSAPRRVFVNSMSDLFQRAVPDSYIRRVVDVMLRAEWHTFQVLTKRAERMSALLKGPLRDAAAASHIWWGVSVEDVKYGVPRIRHLQDAPASTRFLSVEPLLEDLGPMPLDGIHWVIVGGESGAGARAISPDWVRSIRDQCGTANVPFFFKQWGGVRKKEAGRKLDGVVYDEMPSTSTKPILSRHVRRALAEEVSRNQTARLIPLRIPRSSRKHQQPSAANRRLFQEGENGHEHDTVASG